MRGSKTITPSAPISESINGKGGSLGGRPVPKLACSAAEALDGASWPFSSALDEGNFDYAGGSYEEERGNDQLTYRIEGSVGVRFADELTSGSEDFIIEDSSNTADYPIGCVYSLEFDSNLAGATDQGEDS